jgi:hypothetical protein
MCKHKLASGEHHIALAKRARQAGDFSLAEELFLKAYEQVKSLKGDNHSEAVTVLLHLATVCEDQGKTLLAAEYRKEVEHAKATIAYRFMRDDNPGSY